MRHSRLGSRCTASPMVLRSLLLVAFLFDVAPALAEAAFAVARDARGQFWHGYATNRATQAEARQEAMLSCQVRGPGCHIFKEFRLGCYAFAAASKGAAGDGQGPDVAVAEQRALATCASYGGRDCSVQISFCDTVSEPIELALARAQQARADIIRSDKATPGCSMNGRRIILPGLLHAEILGRRVLFYTKRAPDQGGLGMSFELGKTVNITQELSELSIEGIWGKKRPRESVSTQGTASFDGSELILRLDEVARAEDGHSHFASKSQFVASILSYKLEINNCDTCRLRELRITVLEGIGANRTDRTQQSQECRIEEIR